LEFCGVEDYGFRNWNGYFADVRGVAIGWSRQGDAANCPLQDNRPEELRTAVSFKVVEAGRIHASRSGTG